uniref:Uncharacterized protein n=1 Tax=Rhizophora mucronata TaxID=61149 RepID=A0A2P2Q7P4_RHIMU
MSTFLMHNLDHLNAKFTLSIKHGILCTCQYIRSQKIKSIWKFTIEGT